MKFNFRIQTLPKVMTGLSCERMSWFLMKEMFLKEILNLEEDDEAKVTVYLKVMLPMGVK